MKDMSTVRKAFLHTNWASVPTVPKWVSTYPNMDAQSLKAENH